MSIGTNKIDEDSSLTILIPAFNMPDLTIRSLKSIFAQNYRPIKVIISFDKSDTDMMEVENLCHLNKSLDLSFEFHYQEKNLGAYQNMNYLWSCLKSRYFMFMPHDDFFIDTEFLSESMNIFAKQDGHTLVIGNTGNLVASGFGTLMMNIFSMPTRWETLDGDEFFENRLFKDLHPAYSAVIIDSLPLMQKEYSKSWLPEKKYSSLKLEPDEGFVALIMASSGSKVMVTNEVVSIRGNPDSSWSKTEFWQKYGFHGLLIQYVNLYKLSRNINQSNIAAMALRLCTTTIMISSPPFGVLKLAVKLGGPPKFLLVVWIFSSAKKKMQFFWNLLLRFARKFAYS